MIIRKLRTQRFIESASHVGMVCHARSPCSSQQKRVESCLVDSDADSTRSLSGRMTLNLLGIATTGGDAPGMNAAVRASVRTATANGLRVIGFERGYAGILANESRFLDARSVGGIVHLGGTLLKTARADEMKTPEGISKATRVLTQNRVEGLVVIGGNGSMRAACRLHETAGIPIVGIPATIDNDLAGTDTTIGFDTAG